MHSIHSMIQRFRETKPTPRRERRKQRQQGQLTELWWVRQESPAGKDDGDDLGFTQDSLEGAARSSVGREKIRPSGLQTRRGVHNDHSSPDLPRLAVDKIMSEDIEGFLATGSNRPNRSPRRAPLVLPSASATAISGAPVKTSYASYPLSKLVPTSYRDTINQRLEAPHDEEKRHHKYQRESLALGAPPPYSYKGRAELRGEIVHTPSQASQEDYAGGADFAEKIRAEALTGEDLPRSNCCWKGCLERRHRMEHSQEDAQEAIMPSAASVTLDLDVVMDQMRSSMGQNAQAGCPGQLIPGGDLPVSLAQIGLDLDAQLLEFTLMAKAREQAGDEVDKTEEAIVHVSTQGETTRLTAKVLEIGDSQGQEEREDGIFNNVLVAPTKPSWVGIGSPEDGSTDGRATKRGMALVTEGILRTECDHDLGSLIEECPFPNDGRVLRHPVGPIMALPSDGEDSPVVPQSWLYGHTTLQQTGQSIGAELEVAMLCMQKRLAKQPIVIGGENEATDVLNQEVIVVKVHGKLEKGSQKDIAVDTESDNKRECWLQENLEVLADNMASRALRETSELDRELGLDFSDDISDKVGEPVASTKMERGLPAGVNIGAVGTVEMGSRPLVSSRSYFPRHITYDIPDDSLLSPRGKPRQQSVKSKTEKSLQNKFEVEAATAGATNVALNPSACIPPTLAPGDDVSFRRPPPTPARQAELGEYVSSFRLPRTTRPFVRGNAETRDQRRLNRDLTPTTDRLSRKETYSQRPRRFEYDGVDDDAWGPGFALARARQRLRSFQTTRWGMSTPDERLHRHHTESEAQLSVDRQEMRRQPHVGDNNLLNRLKFMRRAYSLNASPREE